MVKAIKASKRNKAKAIVKKKRAKKVQKELIKATTPLAAASADPRAWSESVDVDVKKGDSDQPITFWQAVREMFGFK